MISNACPPPPHRRILLNYAVFNPDMGYCQGMSDLVAPLLTEIQDESDTFWCFVGLMENTIFISSPRDEDMERQLVGGYCFFLVLNLQGFFLVYPHPPRPQVSIKLHFCVSTNTHFQPLHGQLLWGRLNIARIM